MYHKVEFLLSFLIIRIQINVPRGAVGIIIGKAGAMIKRIQEETGAKIQFKEGQSNAGLVLTRKFKEPVRL